MGGAEGGGWEERWGEGREGQGEREGWGKKYAQTGKKVGSLEMRYRGKNEEMESFKLGIWPMISGSSVLQK